MNTKLVDVKRLAEWYQNHAQPFLLKHLPDKVTEFDKDLAMLKAVEAAIDKPMAACFLGSAGIGKSTLINSLVGGAEVIVPAGGIGPLTAQAMKVRYHEEPYFEVQYHALGNLWQLVFALEQAHKLDI